EQVTWRGTKLAHCGRVCAPPPQVAGNRTRHDICWVGFQLVVRAACADGSEGCLGGGDARQHGIVRALDARNVHEARRAAHENATRKREPGDGLPAALRERPRPVSDASAAGEGFANGWVGLEALKLPVGGEVGVLIVEMDDEPDRDQVAGVVIKERTAAGSVLERPSKRMLHETRLVRFRSHLPQLLKTDAVLLGLPALFQAELGDERFGERPACTLADERVLASQLHAAGEAVGRLTVLADPHVTGGDAGYGTPFIVDD